MSEMIREKNGGGQSKDSEVMVDWRVIFRPAGPIQGRFCTIGTEQQTNWTILLHRYYSFTRFSWEMKKEICKTEIAILSFGHVRAWPFAEQFDILAHFWIQTERGRNFFVPLFSVVFIQNLKQLLWGGAKGTNFHNLPLIHALALNSNTFSAS